MKNLLFAILTVSLFLFSCSKETTDNLVDNKIQDDTEKGRFDTAPFIWDYEYASPLAPGEMLIDGMTPTGIYVGAVYPLSSIDNGLFDKEVANFKKNPVRMLFKFYSDFKYEMNYTIDEWEYSEAFENAFNSKKYADHVQAIKEGEREKIECRFTEYTSLNDLEKAFGANVKLAKTLSAKIALNSKQVNIKSRLIGYLGGKNFKVSMVTPTNGFFADTNDNNRADLAYVRSLSYGKLLFFAIESPYSYNATRAALGEGLKCKFVESNANYDKESRQIIADSRITMMAIGDYTNEIFYMNKPSIFQSMLNTPFTKLAYGKPGSTHIKLKNILVVNNLPLFLLITYFAQGF